MTTMTDEYRIACAVYRCQRRLDTYLYVRAKDDFSEVPEALLGALGRLVHVMDLELHPRRKLAQEDVLEVMYQLRERGWFLQMPRQEDKEKAH